MWTLYIRHSEGPTSAINWVTNEKGTPVFSSSDVAFCVEHLVEKDKLTFRVALGERTLVARVEFYPKELTEPAPPA